MPSKTIAVEGVWFTGCTYANRVSASSRRPKPESKRLAATKLPLKIFSSDNRAAAMMTLTIPCEPMARSNATAVAKRSCTRLCQGFTYATAVVTIA